MQVLRSSYALSALPLGIPLAVASLPGLPAKFHNSFTMIFLIYIYIFLYILNTMFIHSLIYFDKNLEWQHAVACCLPHRPPWVNWKPSQAKWSKVLQDCCWDFSLWKLWGTSSMLGLHDDASQDLATPTSMGRNSHSVAVSIQLVGMLWLA